MSRIVPIEFLLDVAEFNQQIVVKIEQVFCERIILEIKNFPSIFNALELTLQDWFKLLICRKQNLFGIIFKINEEIDEKFNENPQVVALNLKDSILFSFQSTLGGHESKTFWKIPGREKFYSLFIDDDETEEMSSCCRGFLTGEISGGKSGILSQFINKGKIRLHEIGDSDGNNLLALAVSRNQLNVIQKLLQHEFNANNVIDQAWKNYIESHDDDRKKQETNEIILCLLKANSKFPSHFDYEEASKEVTEFVDLCENLHKDVDDSNFDALKVKLEQRENLCHFYNRKNQSLLAHALKTEKFEILDLLDKGISTGSHEDLEEVYENMGKKDCRQLRGKHQKNAREFPEPHLLALRLKSNIGNNDQFSHKHWKFIEEAFETLNRNKYCSKILKVAALCKKLKIFFDFKHDCTYYLDPATSYYSKGIIYESGPICIGAKYLTDDDRKFEVFGVLAHELCHLAVYMAFMNRNFDPFPIGESEVKRRYIDQVMVQCEKREDSERIVANVFKSYPKKVQDSEMIVTVPQMLIEYLEDEEKITQHEKTYEELFKYSKEVVEPELDKALPILKLLDDKCDSIKFEDLTEPMKAKILHSGIKFQGQDTSLFEIFGKDAQICELLASNTIRDILINNEPLKIGEICEQDLKYEITERKFFDSTIHEEFKSRSIQDQYILKHTVVGPSSGRILEQIRAEYKNSKVFILTDHAGTGKTTTFKYFAAKLKKENKNFWVSFINLRKCDDIFEKNIKAQDHLSIKDVLEFLTQIVAEDSEIKAKIFKKLFANGKIVLLFDGVDEICPKFRKIIMKIFEVIQASDNKNEHWISTRPHYGNKLKEILKVPAYRFVPFNEEEIEKLVMQIIEQKGTKNQEEKIKCLAESMFVIQGIEFKSANIFIMVMIAELSIDRTVDFSSISIYGIFAAMIKMQKEKLGEKIPNEDRDPLGQLNVWTVSQVLALTLLIGDDYKEKLGFNLRELSIMKLWNNEKQNWTSDMIQRYGFLNVDLDDQMKRSSIDFMHRTYAEFFVAKYLVEFIIDKNGTDRDEEVRRKYKLFELVMSNEFHGHHTIRTFILMYFAVEARQTKINFQHEIKNLLLESIHQIQRELNEFEKLQSYESITLFNKAILHFETYAGILYLDKKMSAKLWKINRKKNIFHQIIRKSFLGFVHKGKVVNLAELSFGSNWHEHFNKNGAMLIGDEDIERLKDQNYCLDDNQWVDDKNLLKLCDLVDKNFEENEKQMFYINIFRIDEVNSENICKLIFKRMKNALNKKSYSIIILDRPNYFKISYKLLLFIQEQVEKVFEYDRESIQKLLFEDLCTESSPLAKSIASSNLNIFQVTLNFYKKYRNSNDDMRKVLDSCGPIFYLSATCSDIYSEIKKLIQEICDQDISKIMENIQNYFEKVNFFCPNNYLGNYQDFLIYIFSNNKEKIFKCFQKTIPIDGISANLVF